MLRLLKIGEYFVVSGFMRYSLTCLLLLVAVSLRAELVTNLYEVRVPVADRSQAALDSASRQALSQVFVKVTGGDTAAANPTLAVALGKSRSYVQQYAYLREVAAEQPLSVRFEFDGQVINDLVAQAGVPLWTANRPSVLVWLVVEDQQGRTFVSMDLASEMAAELASEFDSRGVPSQLPLFDLADSAALSTDQAWRLSAPALLAASQRYGGADILAGRVASLSTGSWLGDWSYLSGGRRLDRSVTAGSTGEFIQSGVALVAGDMSSRYAVAATRSVSSGVPMVVQGVRNYADYAGIVAWLEGLELIDYANVEQIEGQRILLRLHAQAGAQQLAAIIELNERLVPVQQPLSEQGLSYQWQN
jgi:hypothetical protein